jgi:hypothetical protein
MAQEVVALLATSGGLPIPSDLVRRAAQRHECSCISPTPIRQLEIAFAGLSDKSEVKQSTTMFQVCEL